MTFAQLRELAASVGFQGEAADIAAAIALAESGGDPMAQGDPLGPFGPVPNGSSSSFGLWQVHLPAHPQYDAAKLLQDVGYSARAAFAISRSGTVWTPWSTFNNGAYKRFLPTEGNA